MRGTVTRLPDNKIRGWGQIKYRRGSKVLLYTGEWIDTDFQVSFFTSEFVVFTGQSVLLNGVQYCVKSERTIVTHFSVSVFQDNYMNSFILRVPVVDGACFQLELDLDESLFNIELGDVFQIVPGLPVNKLTLENVGTEKENVFRFGLCLSLTHATFSRTNLYKSTEGNYTYEYRLRASPIQFLTDIYPRLPKAPCSVEVIKMYLK